MPTDSEIKGIIHIAYKQATALAKILMMKNSENFDNFITMNVPSVEEEDDDEVICSSSEPSSNFFGNNSIDYFISLAAREMDKQDDVELEDGDESNYKGGLMEISRLLNPNQVSCQPLEKNQVQINSFETGVLYDQLDLDFFIHQRHTHEAYSNRRMERKVIGIRLQHDEQTINQNFAQSVASYLSANHTTQPGIPRRNRWLVRSRLEVLEKNIPVLSKFF